MATGLDAKQAAMLAALQNLSAGLGDRYAAAEDAQAAMIGPDAPRQGGESDGVVDTILGRIGNQARSVLPAAKALLADPAGALGRAGAAYDKSLGNHRAFGHEVAAEHPEATALGDVGGSLASLPVTGPRSLAQAAALGAMRTAGRSEDPSALGVLGEAVDGGALEGLGFLGGQALSKLVPNPAAEAAAARKALIEKADDLALKGSGRTEFITTPEPNLAARPPPEELVELQMRKGLFDSTAQPSSQPYEPGQNPFAYDRDPMQIAKSAGANEVTAAAAPNSSLRAAARPPNPDELPGLGSKSPWYDPPPAAPGIGTRARWLLDDAGTAARDLAPKAKAAAFDGARKAAAPTTATIGETIAALLQDRAADQDEEGR